MRKIISLFLVMLVFAESLLAGIPSDASVYIGGTTTSIDKGTTGIMSTDDAAMLVYRTKKEKDKKLIEWALAYPKITSLAYGQHAGRRVGATVAWGVTTLGIMALPMLFSKKRRHYLTIEYSDADNKPQAAVFEVGKDAVRTLLKSLEVRTGQKIAYEDDEARKSGNK